MYTLFRIGYLTELHMFESLFLNALFELLLHDGIMFGAVI